MSVVLAFHGAAGTVTGSHYVLQTPTELTDRFAAVLPAAEIAA